MGLRGGYTVYTRHVPAGKVRRATGPVVVHKKEIIKIRGCCVQSRKKNRLYTHAYAQVTCAACAHRTAESNSEREHGRVLSCAEHVHERLTHEKSNGDTDRNRYHSTPDVYPVARCGDRSTCSLRETRLQREKNRVSQGRQTSPLGT